MPKQFCLNSSWGLTRLALAIAFVACLIPGSLLTNGQPENSKAHNLLGIAPDNYALGSNQTIVAPLTLPLTDPHIVVSKRKRRLELFDGKVLLRSYRIGLGFNPVGDKVKEGDGRTPEGEFYVCVKNENSKFYLSLGLSYPGPKDAARGLRSGLITQKQYDDILAASKDHTRPPWDTPLGGEIFIHGNGSKEDWTWGCVALEDSQIKELFDAAPLGTRVEIYP